MTTPAPTKKFAKGRGRHSQTSQSPATSTARTAPSPFDKVGADIILRTSDLVDFHVYSHVLILASPFFETMFSLPQSHQSSPDDAQTVTDNRPVIDVTENSTTLETLLRICYPIERQSSVRSLTQLEAEWNAAVKYEMAAPRPVLMTDLLDAAKTSPLAAWAVACRVGLEPLARRAAENMPRTSPLVIAPEDLTGVTAGDLYRLREFHSGRAPADFHLLTPSKSTASGGGTPDSDGDIHASIPSCPSFSEQGMPFADFICRSSDGVEFEVHRGVVSTASAMLHKRIQAVLTEWEESAKTTPFPTKPILQLDEEKTMVSVLLRMCYQPFSDLPRNPTTLCKILVAAEKYELDGVCKAVLNQWGNWATRGVDALSFYLVAAGLEWKEIAQEAAAHTLSDPLLPSSAEHHSYLVPTSTPLYSPIMESTPATVYLTLVRYHEAYLRAAQEIFQNFSRKLAKVLHKAILSPHDTFSFTSDGIIESYRQGYTSGYAKDYHYGSEPNSTIRNLQEALDKMVLKMKELTVAL